MGTIKAYIAGTIVGAAMGMYAALQYAETTRAVQSYITDIIKSRSSGIVSEDETTVKITQLEKRISDLEKQSEKQTEDK